MKMWQKSWREKLKKLRNKINQIDFKIINLLGARMEVCRNIGIIKTQNNLPIYVPKRELEVIKNRQQNAGKKDLSDRFIKIIFRLIMTESKKIQKNNLNKNTKPKEK